MKTIVPDYCLEFKYIANRCKHTCCQGWEVEIDEESLSRFLKIPEIMKRIEIGEDIHFKLSEDEVCPSFDGGWPLQNDCKIWPADAVPNLCRSP